MVLNTEGLVGHFLEIEPALIRPHQVESQITIDLHVVLISLRPYDT